MVRIKEINGYNEFRNLRETWNNVLNKSRDNNIFLTWEWLWTWWKHYGKRSQLVILLAEEQDKAIGIAPTMYSVYRLFGFRLGKIEFIGATKYSDYSNFILTEKKTECLKSFINYLNDYPAKYDCLEFRGMPETAESLNQMRVICKHVHTFEERECDICPYISLPNSFEVYCGELDGKMQRGLHRCLRRLREKYKVEFTGYGDNESLQYGIEALFELHQKRWRTRGLPGLFRSPTFRNFISEIAECFAKKGWLDLSALTADGKPIASLLSFKYNGKFYCYSTGFDPAYSRYSPGSLLLLHLIEECIQKGVEEFDFLRGAEAYKGSWNTLNRRIVELSKNKGLLSSLYSHIKKSNGFIAQKLKSMHEW